MAEQKEIIIKERYQLKEKAKEELTGTIYNGWDAQLKKAVQIKRYRPELLSASLVEKIQESLYRLTVVNQPLFLIPTDSSIEKQNFFVVQEALKDEETIADILAKLKAFTQDSAQLTARQVAQAMSYLHKKKISHGNITPANICVLKDGSIKIKNVLIDAIIQHAYIQKGKILANPSFISPEQLQGKPTKPQSDIWAIGILLYKLLTGTTPFKESSDKNQMLQNFTTAPVLPTLRNPKIPKYLEDVILKAINQEPQNRQSSMIEFLSQLESKKVPIKLNELGIKKKTDLAAKQPAKADMSNKKDLLTRNDYKAKKYPPVAKKPVTVAKKERKGPGLLASLFHKTKQVTTPEMKAKFKQLPQHVPHKIRHMADKFDQMIETKKTQAPLFARPKTLLQKLLLYGTTIIAIGISIALVQSLVIGYFTSIPEIKVPALTGLPLEEAKDLLESKGLKSDVVSELINTAVPMDHIISQKPDAGRVVKKDRVIKLFVSKGVGEAKVPELIGRALEQAKTMLSRNGLGLEVAKYVYNAQVQKNYILKQNPDPEVIVQKNTTVNVIVSDGFPAALKLKDKSAYNCVVEAMLFVPNNWEEQAVKLILSDSRGSRTVFNQRIPPGQKKRVQLISEDTALVEVFYNDELALKQSFLELQDLTEEEQ